MLDAVKTLEAAMHVTELLKISTQVIHQFLRGPSCMHTKFHMQLLCPIPICHQHWASTLCCHKGERTLIPQFCIAHS